MKTKPKIEKRVNTSIYPSRTYDLKLYIYKHFEYSHIVDFYTTKTTNLLAGHLLALFVHTIPGLAIAGAM